MLALDSGGLVCVLILTGGRWASALAGRTGTWLSKLRPSPALPAAWCSHGLAVFYTHKCRDMTSIKNKKASANKHIVKSKCITISYMYMLIKQPKTLGLIVVRGGIIDIRGIIHCLLKGLNTKQIQSVYTVDFTSQSM